MKQEDLISQILFDLLIDEFLTSVPKEGGLKLEDIKIATLAYVDDVVLLTKSRRDGKEVLRRPSSFRREV